MRRSALLGTMMLPTILLLGGCSGLGKFFDDTITLPGMNPNLPYGLSENINRAKGRQPEEAPILPEPGNVWPGPPQPLPSLGQASRQQGESLSGSIPGAGGASMNDGGSMSMGEKDAISNGATSGADSFSGAGAGSGGAGAGGGGTPDIASRYRMKPQSSKGDSIVIPNGDGTSTVIGPDGTVKTVKGTPK